MIVFNFQSYFKSARIWIFFTYNYSKRWREAKENAIHICNCISKICFGNNPIPIVCVSHNTWQSNFNGKKREETQSETWAFSWYLFYTLPFSSIDESEAESSNVEFEMVSDWLPFSLSEIPDAFSSTGCFMNQCIILAVNVRIIFWFTWNNWKKNIKTRLPNWETLLTAVDDPTKLLIEEHIPQLCLQEAKILSIQVSLQYW